MQNVSSCRRIGPIDGQGCALRFGLKETHSRSLGEMEIRDTIAQNAHAGCLPGVKAAISELCIASPYHANGYIENGPMAGKFGTCASYRMLKSRAAVKNS
jgi:hypothetical protein